MSARDVIAQALHDQIDLRFGAVPWEDDCARVAIEALTAAGFSIVHKDEIHGPSVERAASEIATLRAMLRGQNVVLDIAREVATYDICEAVLRKLKESGQ